MHAKKDYILVPDALLNDGLTTGSVYKVAALFTRSYFFIISYESKDLWNRSDSRFKSPESFIVDITETLDSLSIDAVNIICKEFLPNRRIYEPENLEILKVNAGILSSGSLKIKKKGEQIQKLKIRERSVLGKIKKFYHI
jgi:hypothetical protein